MQKKRTIKKCIKCKDRFEIRPCELSRKYCSQSCHYSDRPSGKYHFNWKGGRGMHHEGYVTLHIKKKRFLEHRVVMEKILGRKLNTSELVHHRNGKKTDNRTSNLQLTDRASHASLHHKGVTRKT